MVLASPKVCMLGNGQALFTAGKIKANLLKHHSLLARAVGFAGACPQSKCPQAAFDLELFRAVLDW